MTGLSTTATRPPTSHQGKHYDGPGWPGLRRWKVQSLMTGETLTIEASSRADAPAQYLDVVMSNLLMWEDTTRPSRSDDKYCDECGAVTGELVSPGHGPACSLNPANEVIPRRAARRGGIDDVAARIDPTKARYAVAGVCAALGRELDWASATCSRSAEWTKGKCTAMQPNSVIECKIAV